MPKTMTADADRRTEPDSMPSAQAFTSCFRELRIRLGGKQAWLAASVGCSEAAVSLWETGRRVPDTDTFFRISVVFAEAGASTHELLILRRHWRMAKAERKIRVL